MSKMRIEIIMFGNIEVKKHKFHSYRTHDDVNIV